MMGAGQKVISGLYLGYMSQRHITHRKASVHRGFRAVGLYGYMFLKNSDKRKIMCHMNGSHVAHDWCSVGT